jgi:hypothetical protein
VLIWTKVAQGKKQCSASAQRKRHTALRCELEMESRKVGCGDPALVFAFSRDHADWEFLRKRGNMADVTAREGHGIGGL